MSSDCPCCHSGGCCTQKNCSRTNGCQSYGSYSTCANCGVNGMRSTWNSLDTCPTSQSMSVYTPDERCDYQEKMSRNRYDWKEAFDYGTVQECQGMDYGSNGASCMYMGSLSPTDVSSPWGYPAGGVVKGASYVRGKKDASYGGYIGIMDKDRTAPYVSSSSGLDQNSCGYDAREHVKANQKSCDLAPTVGGPVTQNSQLCMRNLPFVPYEQF